MDGLPPGSSLMVLGKLLRLFFSLLYNQFAWTYDAVASAVSWGRWKEWVLTTLPHLEAGQRVLELGHGPGHLQAAGARNGIRMFGMDASRNMGRIAYRRSQAAGLQPRQVYGYAQAIPFDASSFERVVSTFPTEYIADPRTIAEIHRILIEGGTLLVLPAAWIEGRSLPDRLLAALFRLTAQAPPSDSGGFIAVLTDRLVEARFSVQAEKVPGRSSRVLLITAVKRV